MLSPLKEPIHEMGPDKSDPTSDNNMDVSLFDSNVDATRRRA